jgi:hypothetical protein
MISNDPLRRCGRSPLVRLLAAALVAMTVSGWQYLVLVAGGRQRVTLYDNAGALVLAMGLYFWLVGALGLMGAALPADPRRLARVLLAAGGTAAVLAGRQAVCTFWVLLVVAAAVLYAPALRSVDLHRSVREAFA